MKKFSIAVLILLLLIFSLCGCSDSREIDETAYLIALGIDKSDSDGFTYTLQFSAPLATMEGGGGGGGEGGDSKKNSTVTNISISAPDFYTARNMTNNFLSKNIDMSHLKLIVFAKALEDDDFFNHSRFLLREREIRPHTSVAVSLDSAKEYLEAVNPELEANTAKYYELMSLRSNNIYSPTKRLADFVDEISSSDGVSVLPIAHSGEKPQQNPEQNTATAKSEMVDVSDSNVHSPRAGLQGMAIFKNGGIISTDNGNKAMLYNILTGGIKTCTVSFENPYDKKQILTFRLNIPNPPTYSFDNQKKPCRVTVSQGFDIEFFGGTLPKGFSDSSTVFAFAKGSLQKAFSEFLYDLSRNKKADILNLSKHYKLHFLTTDSFNASENRNFFETAEFEVNIDFFNLT